MTRALTPGRDAERLLSFARAALLCAPLVSLVFGASTASAGGSAAPRILSPGTDQLVTDGSVRVVVKLPPGAGAFRAWLDQKSITDRFAPSDGRQVAVLRGSQLRRGVNSVYVQTGGGSGRAYDAANFIVAQRDRHLLRLGLRLGSRTAPAVARVTHAHDSELRVTLNGRRVRHAFLHQSGQTRVARLGVPEGVRFGENRLVVRAVRLSGTYDVVERRFRIPRNRHLANAGTDRRMVIGSSIELDAAATRVGGERTDARPRYRWRVVESPPSADADGATGERAAVPLGAARTATPSFEPREPGTYAIRVRVPASGGAEASHDTVLVAARPNDPPIGVRVEAAGADGVITIDGKAVPNTSSGAGSISYDLLDRTTRAAPTTCATSVPYAGSVSKSVQGVQRLEQLVGDCSDPRYLLILGSSSGIGEDRALTDELSKLLESIGGSALDDEATGAQFSAFGIPTAPEGSAFTSFGEFPGTRRGSLSGYLQYQGAVKEYGFQFADFPIFETRPANAPAGHVAVRVGGELIAEPIPSGPSDCNPDNATPCAGFHVVSVDVYDLHVRFQGVFAVNTGYGAAEDQAAQSAMRQQLTRFNPSDLVFIQSYGDPRATTPEWDGIGLEVRRLGGTRTVFDRLDGKGGYALIGSTCQPPGALGCNTAFGGSAAAVEASSVRGGTGSLLQDVVSREPREVHLRGVLARNHDDRFQAAPSDTSSAATNQLLPVLYGPGEPFPAFTAGEQGANAYITRALLQNQAISPPDLRQHYWLHYDDPEKWANRRISLGNLRYADAAATCSCTDGEFDKVKRQLDHEIEALIYVQDWVKSMQDVLAPKYKDVVDLQALRDDVQAAVRPPDVDTGGDAGGGIFGFLFSLGEIVFPEEGPIASLLFQGVGLLAADDSGVDGSPLLGEIDEKTSQLISRILDDYEVARGSLVDMGKIIASDYGKLTTVASHVNAGPWAFPDNDVPLRTGISKGFRSYLYSELMPLVWKAWEVPQVGGANARTLGCFEPRFGPIYPFVNATDSAQYVAVGGMGTGQFPTPEIRDLTVALGRQPNEKVPFPSFDAKPPPASLIDPLFAPASLDPRSPNLGLFPTSVLENEFNHVTLVPPEDRPCSRQ